MKISAKALAMTVLLLFFGGIALTSAFNLWRTESLKIPAKFKEGQFIGEYNPADIRGSYSFGDVSRHFQIPLGVLAQAFGIEGTEDELANFKNKNLESLYGYLKDEGKEIGNASVKLFVALYTGLPYQLDEETYLPAPAVAVLKAAGYLSPEWEVYFESHSVDISGREKANEPSLTGQPIQNKTLDSPPVIVNKEVTPTQPPVERAEPVTSPGTQAERQPKGSGAGNTDRAIKGNTNFREVLDWGLSREAIEEVLGHKMPNPLTSIRDFCMQNGIEFGTVKQKLQEKIDSL
ncbi:MAG: hypothetical protein ACOY9Y_11525 [Bacillota bacterium]